MWVHRINGVIILVTTIILAALIIDRTGVINPNPKARLGLACLILVIIVPFGGILARSRLNRSKWNTLLTMIIKYLHKVNKIP